MTNREVEVATTMMTTKALRHRTGALTVLQSGIVLALGSLGVFAAVPAWAVGDHITIFLSGI